MKMAVATGQLNFEGEDTSSLVCSVYLAVSTGK